MLMNEAEPTLPERVAPVPRGWRSFRRGARFVTIETISGGSAMGGMFAGGALALASGGPGAALGVMVV
jgi:hypothetical protein